MENGMNIPPLHHQQPQQHLQQQYHHHQPTSAQAPDFYGYSSAPHHPPQSIMYRPPSTSVGSVASTVSIASSSTSSSHKRGRVGSETSTTSVLSFQQYQQPQYQYPNGNPPIVQVVQYSLPDDDDDEVSQRSSITPKKARPSNYQPPRTVKPSLLSAMGTLAASPISSTPTALTAAVSSPFPFGFINNNNHNNTHVPMRRRLSGGHLEEFLGNHNDTMDGMDTSGDNRPRSMSF
jgi:hypothetical protein